MVRRSSIDGLPDDVRRWLERALAESNFSGYQALEEILRTKGYQISKSAIHRHGQKIERRFAAIKASTEAARFLTEGAADDQDAVPRPSSAGANGVVREHRESAGGRRRRYRSG
ncbi:phage protein Gp27 family protein [Pandoraea norimbergensis]|uniref:phage protein Gp27 family protein n=1 Tax=Pandoraea norimbergensis TaxID=93219 RepID=UPI00202A49F4|nr:phage protein Gp27 family protein [Pandoraea norimbergensis]